MLRAVVFDLDDTLVDEATAIRRAARDWARSLHVEDHLADDRWVRVSAEPYQRYLDGVLTYGAQGAARVRAFLGTPLSDQEAEALFASYLEMYRTSWRLFDDAIPALRRAREAGLEIAVLTNGDATQQRVKLTSLGIAENVDRFLASSEIGVAKPHPAAFQAVVRELGCQPYEAVMIGDHPVNDIAGGRRAGLPAVLLDRFDRYPTTTHERVVSLDELDFTDLLGMGALSQSSQRPQRS